MWCTMDCERCKCSRCDEDCATCGKTIEDCERYKYGKDKEG